MSEHILERPLDPLGLGEPTLEALGIKDGVEMQVQHPWERLGAETYVSDFFLGSSTENHEHLIAKACIKRCSGIVLRDWFARREALTKNGVKFPDVRFIDFEHATWVEEFVPHTFEEAYKAATDEERVALENELYQLYLRIEGAGFKLSSEKLHDLRSHGTDVIMIDVGEDVGGHLKIDSCNLEARDRAEKKTMKTLGKMATLRLNVL